MTMIDLKLLFSIRARTGCTSEEAREIVARTIRRARVSVFSFDYFLDREIKYHFDRKRRRRQVL